MLFRWFLIHASFVSWFAGIAASLTFLIACVRGRRGDPGEPRRVAGTVTLGAALLLLSAVVIYPWSQARPGETEARMLQVGIEAVQEEQVPHAHHVRGFTVGLGVMTLLALAAAWAPIRRRLLGKIAGAAGIGVFLLWLSVPCPVLIGRVFDPRNVPASLRTLVTAQADFRANDRDGNGKQDYWVGDVSGLYALTEGRDGRLMMLIDLSVAAADARPLPEGAHSGRYRGIDPFAVRVPKAGYLFAVIPRRADGRPYAQDLDGDGSAFESEDGYAFCAYPEDRRSGTLTFIVDEKGVVYRRKTERKPVDRWPGDPRGEGWIRVKEVTGRSAWEDDGPAGEVGCMGLIGALPLGLLAYLFVRRSSRWSLSGEAERGLHVTGVLAGFALWVLLVSPLLSSLWPRFDSLELKEAFHRGALGALMGILLSLPFLLALAWGAVWIRRGTMLRQAAAMIAVLGLAGGLYAAVLYWG